MSEMSITTGKNENFSNWYTQVITKCNLIKYYDVSGCYVLLPDSYNIWETIQQYLDEKFKKMDVKNVYFPLFITEKNLKKESNHIEGFQPEVAWITRAGSTDLHEPIAVRPTSECAIYSILPSLISSEYDLPLKYNQWCNVVRWEFKDPTPFIRSREFLWQEGHTCFKSLDESLDEIRTIITLYKNTYKKLLAVPVIMGEKTEYEKFSGALKTLTVECFIPEIGKGIQGATAHCLGQNFSKMFDIQFSGSSGQNNYVWQNSWGFTTRSIGVAIMTHGDDIGMINPPNIALVQIVIIPIFNDKTKESVVSYINNIKGILDAMFRTKVDYSNHNAGWKYNHWETMGVPLRIEIGPRDVANNKITIVRRDQLGKKQDMNVDDNFSNNITDILTDIQISMYETAKNKMINSLTYPNNMDQFIDSINNKKMCLIPFCDETECEKDILRKSGAKSLCKPIKDKYKLSLDSYTICINCSKLAICTCLFGKSF